jgi:hypothetical protein
MHICEDELQAGQRLVGVSVMRVKGTLTPVVPRIARKHLISSRANEGLTPTFSE